MTMIMTGLMVLAASRFTIIKRTLMVMVVGC